MESWVDVGDGGGCCCCCGEEGNGGEEEVVVLVAHCWVCFFSVWLEFGFWFLVERLGLV